MEMQLRKSLKHESKCFLSDFSEREKERPLILLGQCKPNRSYLKRQENRLLNWYLGLRVFFAVQTKKKKKKTHTDMSNKTFCSCVKCLSSY